jgi:hypothetical protein
MMDLNFRYFPYQGTCLLSPEDEILKFVGEIQLRLA